MSLVVRGSRAMGQLGRAMAKYGNRSARRRGPVAYLPVRRKGTRKGKSRGTVIGRSLGFPDKMTFKHRYVDVVQIASVTGALGTYRFACNGLYDPNITGTGHQPLWFDNMAAIYNHYQVIGSRCRVTITDYSTTASETSPFYVGLYTEDDTVTSPDYLGIMEQKRGVSRACPFNFTQSTVTMTQKFSARKEYGSGSLADVNLSGTSISNPSELTYYTVWVKPTVPEDCVIQAKVEIEYIAVWTELKRPESS